MHHYFYGYGAPVTLSEIGMAKDENASSVAEAVQEFELNIFLSDPAERVYGDTLFTDVTNVSNNLWSIGGSSVSATAVCGSDGCSFFYSLRDQFADPLTIGGIAYFGHNEVPPGVPYQINDDWGTGYIPFWKGDK